MTWRSWRVFGFRAGKWLPALVGPSVDVCQYRRFLPLAPVAYLLPGTLRSFLIVIFGSQASCDYCVLVPVV